ncbi:HdeD family acid-resistance protein [Halorientalis brevis]|uniref:HdeD family acid-resistance protein n=1 Tax=Halorientalis brevis TaxID=1126241 RepID=A0ABD6C7N0_9EURY|nr:DUF308 domain-containing protein [Halorientalis brevis]
MSTETPTDATLATVVADKRRTLQAAGVLLALLGVLAIAFPFVTGISLALLFGATLIVGGVFHYAHAFSAAGWSGSIAQVLLGLLYTGAGILLMANPVLTLASLTVLLVAFLAVEGLVLIGLSFTVRNEPNWEWNVFSGLLSLLLAALLWAGLPSTAAWGLGLILGVNLLTTGVGLVFLGRGSEELTGETAETPA